MNNKYANYDYQSTTTPFKNDIGVTIRKETTSKFKLCTKDCKYKSNWNALKEWLIETYMLNIPVVADGSRMIKVLNKMNELEGSTK